MNKAILSTVLAGTAMLSFAAHSAPVDISIGHKNNGLYINDIYSGKKSIYQTNAAFVETFDLAGEAASSIAAPGAAGCGLTTAANITGGTYGFVRGSVDSTYATPKDDKTCYAYGPGPLGTLPPNLGSVDGKPILASVTVDYGNLLAGFPTGTLLNYFGLYYGSIDQYNKIEFFDGANGTGNLVATVSGAQILATCGAACTSGDQTSEETNFYVNLFFNEAEFRSFTFTTWGVAVEIDNLAVGIDVPNAVPEPASLALLGAGLAALGLSRRRKTAK